MPRLRQWFGKLETGVQEAAGNGVTTFKIDWQGGAEGRLPLIRSKTTRPVTKFRLA